MAKKRPPTRPPTSDPHVARMAGDMEGVPERPTRQPKVPPKPPKPPSKAQKEQVKLWEERIRRAGERYKTWSDRFDCKHLDDYYEGRQWRGSADNEAKGKYVINMVFATMESQLPSLMFTKPKVKAEARPSQLSTATSDAGARATLIEQTLQTQLDDPRGGFGYETDLALRDAYPRFGVIEVGYSADWIDNPRAGKPVLKEDQSPMFDGDGQDAKPLMEPDKVLKPGTKESIYYRRIDPASFRVAPGRNALLTNDWYAYKEYLNVADVRRNPEYTNTEALRSSGRSEFEPVLADTDSDETEDQAQSRAGQLCVWKIWDLRAKCRYVYAEGNPQMLQAKPFTFAPHAVMKFFERRNAFYPVPPIWNWMSPQDNINETREDQKIHRRRFKRRYMHEPGVAKTEMEKLETGEDGVAIEVPSLNHPPIAPIADAPLGTDTAIDLAASRDDFNQIAGVSGEIVNSPKSPTATQANIVNVRASIRESRARQQVAEWLAEIARLTLLTLRDRVKGSVMVKRTVDPFAAARDPQQLLKTAGLWAEIESEDVDDLEVDISIDVASLSPVAEEALRNQYTNFLLGLAGNPALVALLSVPIPEAPDEPSPMLRKWCAYNGITSDQEIRETWRVLQQMRRDAAAAAAAQAALSKHPEPIKMSLALKGDDLSGPLGPFFMALITREEGLPASAAAMAQPESPIAPSGNGGGRTPMLRPPRPTPTPTGTPARPPTGMA